MGTAQYLSPEQAQGFSVSAASDLYSIGVILYELLTGAVPFEGETAVAIAFKQVSAEPRPPSELNPALPPSLDAVVLRALAKDPAHRYADADELIAALAREREALPAFSGAAVTTILGPHGPVAAQPPLQAEAGSLLLAPDGRFGEENPPPPQDDRRRRRRRLGWAFAAVLLAGLAALAVVLAQAGNTVTEPDVLGQSEQAAVAALKGAGLAPVVSLAPSAKVPLGRVISQTPPAWSAVKKGARVSIVISDGPPSEGLIDVEGLSASRAAAELRAAHFKPTTKTQSSVKVPAGVVIGTEPPAGTDVEVGSTVRMLVSSGPASVRVPDVTGESLQAAEATLINFELAVGTVTQRVSSQPPGTVLSQSPATGTSVHAGDKVNLTVARAPKEVAVPDVEGQREASAVATLEKAGFASTTVFEAVSEPAKAGVVLKQSPAAGAKARKGATVTIDVGAQTTTTTPTTTIPTTSTPTTTTPTTTTTAPAAAG
jgi:eukaryotic-like serine/threonine-protein kinase